MAVNIETINISQDIQAVFNAVCNTQHKEKNIELDADVVKCETFADVQRVFNSL
jgi:hypothetical protein